MIKSHKEDKDNAVAGNALDVAHTRLKAMTVYTQVSLLPFVHTLPSTLNIGKNWLKEVTFYIHS